MSPEPPHRNQWPTEVGSIGSRTIVQSDSISLDASKYFADPDGDDLAYEVDHSFDFADYKAEIRDKTVTITVNSLGYGKFTLRAKDPGGLFKVQDMFVDVVQRREPITYSVPLFLSSWYPIGEGYVRIINKSGLAGEVRIEAVDDEGTEYEVRTLEVAGGHTVHFNSGDLEDGNPGKGIQTGIGRGEGDWRLNIVSTLDLDVLGYMRTDDGFV